MQREYFKQGKVEQFRQILEEGSSPGMSFSSINDASRCVETNSGEWDFAVWFIVLDIRILF